MALLLRAEIIELATCVGLPYDVLCVPEDAKPAADGHSCAFVVPCDHDHTDASLVAACDASSHLRPWGIQHAHAAHKSQVRL